MLKYKKKQKMNNTESKKNKEYTLNFSIDGKWLADLLMVKVDIFN